MIRNRRNDDDKQSNPHERYNSNETLYAKVMSFYISIGGVSYAGLKGSVFCVPATQTFIFFKFIFHPIHDDCNMV